MNWIVLHTVIHWIATSVAGIAHHLGMTGTEPPWGPFGRGPGGYAHHYLPPHCGAPAGLHAPHFPAHVLALTNPDQPLSSPTRLSSGTVLHLERWSRSSVTGRAKRRLTERGLPTKLVGTLRSKCMLLTLGDLLNAYCARLVLTKKMKIIQLNSIDFTCFIA
jgi:hypothetical protein